MNAKTKSPDRETLLSAEQVAQELGLKTKTVYLLSDEKKLPSVKIGGALRFRPSDLDAFYAESVKQ